MQRSCGVPVLSNNMIHMAGMQRARRGLEEVSSVRKWGLDHMGTCGHCKDLGFCSE